MFTRSMSRIASRWLFAATLTLACVAIAAPTGAFAQSVTYQAQFAVDDVDPWGGSGVHRANQEYAVTWNQSGGANDLETWAGMDFGGSISGSTSGTLGVDFGYDAANGKLDVDYPALVDVDYPDDETYFPGSTIRISTTNRSSAGSFEFDPGAQDYSVNGKLALAASASGELCFVDCFGTINFFPPFSQSAVTIPLINAHANAGQYGDIWNPPPGSGSTHVTGDVNISRPDMSLDIAQQGRMQAASTKSFMHADVDIDAFSSTPLGRSYSASGMALSYDILDGRVNLDGSETHSFDFRPTVRLTFAFPSSMTYSVVSAEGVVGSPQTGTSATIDAGQSLDLTLPVTMTQPFAITPTMTLANSATYSLDHTYDVKATIKVLRMSAGIPGFTVIPGGCFLGICVDALEFPGLTVGFGPVHTQHFPITTAPVHLSTRELSIPFTPAQQAARGFDPENIPVAEAGGPYDVDEGSSIDLDGTRSFDYDSDDVLTYEWKLDGPGTLEASGSTPQFDALDGDHTYVATLTVCDLKLNCHVDTAQVRVHNVAPSHVLETTSTITFGVGQAFLARNGVTVTHAATANDVGTDDTTYTWSAGPFATWVPPTTTFFNDGAGPDPDTSAFGTLPFPTATSSTLTFSQPGFQTLRLVVNDDDGDSTTTDVPILIADSSTTYRSSGSYKQQYSLKGKRELTTTQLDAYLAFTRAGSRTFDEQVALTTSADAYAVLQRLDLTTATTLEQVRAFTLVAWLNVASGAVAFEGPLAARMQVAGRTTTADALREVEAVLADQNSTQAQLVSAMQLAQSIG